MLLIFISKQLCEALTEIHSNFNATHPAQKQFSPRYVVAISQKCRWHTSNLDRIKSCIRWYKKTYKEAFRVEQFWEILESQESCENGRKIESNNKYHGRSTEANTQASHWKQAAQWRRDEANLHVTWY